MRPSSYAAVPRHDHQAFAAERSRGSVRRRRTRGPGAGWRSRQWTLIRGRRGNRRRGSDRVPAQHTGAGFAAITRHRPSCKTSRCAASRGDPHPHGRHPTRRHCRTPHRCTEAIRPPAEAGDHRPDRRGPPRLGGAVAIPPGLRTDATGIPDKHAPLCRRTQVTEGRLGRCAEELRAEGVGDPLFVLVSGPPTWTPSALTGQVAGVCRTSGSLPGGGDLGRGAVAEAGVRPLVVAVDVVPDLPSCLLDGLPLRAPGAALLELAEPGLDERLGLRVAVAAAAVGDAAGGQMLPEVPAGELASRCRCRGSAGPAGPGGPARRPRRRRSPRRRGSADRPTSRRVRGCSSRRWRAGRPSRAARSRPWSCRYARARRGG